jgi:hypothetical protein
MNKSNRGRGHKAPYGKARPVRVPTPIEESVKRYANSYRAFADSETASPLFAIGDWVTRVYEPIPDSLCPDNGLIDKGEVITVDWRPGDDRSTAGWFYQVRWDELPNCIGPIELPYVCMAPERLLRKIEPSESPQPHPVNSP